MTEKLGQKSDFNNGGGRFCETTNRRQGEVSGSNRQQEANFNSYKLTCKGSDRIIFITNGEEIKNVWKRILRKKNPLNQNDVRLFVSSALAVTTTYYKSEGEEFIKELGNPEGGLKRLREIINYPLMLCDAGLDDGVLSFQYVILPLLGLLTRNAITECTLEKCVHAIFMVVYTNIDSFLYEKVMKMLETLVRRNSILDNKASVKELLSHHQYAFIPSSLGIFFLIITRLLTELLRRIKEASINETMHKISHDLQRLKATYQKSIERQQQSSTSTDPLINNLESRNCFFITLKKEMINMNKILNNGRNGLIFEQNPNAKDLNSKLTQSHYRELARKADIIRTYDPPGELSKNGKRHDNDFQEISKISIIPTKEEILCDRLPFLPTSIPGVPHFLPEGAARLFDAQFRLLREDMLNPIRSGIANFLTALSQDLSSSTKNVKLTMELKRIQEGGGRFKCDGDLQVFTCVRFINTACDRRKGLTCTIGFTPPRIRGARSVRDRIAYWRKSKKLLTGTLIAILLPNPNPNAKQVQSNNITSSSDLYSIYFGIVVSRDENDLAERSDLSVIDINFIDPSIYPIVLQEISSPNKITENSLRKRFLVEPAGVYLEAYYHILKTLQNTNPSSLPFEKYLAPKPNLNGDNNEESNEVANSSGIISIKVENPKYTKLPGFQFDLSVLCKNKNEDLKLYVADANTYDEVAKGITEYSSVGKLDKPQYQLDETQAKALIYALTREIALIEGPPGTGKTVIGVQLMKVLLARKNRRTNIGPILTICFTNHALDQFLEDLLDENITNNIVRLGSRTKSDKIKEFNLEGVCKKKHVRYRYDDIDKLNEELKGIEHEINEIKKALSRRMNWNDIREYLMNQESGGFYDKFNYASHKDLPSWVLKAIGYEDTLSLSEIFEKLFERWLKGEDIKIICKRKENLLNLQKKGKNSNDYESQWVKNYNKPETNRPLDVLLKEHLIWKMSKIEREKLHDHWLTKAYKGLAEQLSDLQKDHEEKRQELTDIFDEGRREALLKCDVIGMTTNGAAKYQSLIKSVGPKIIVCEEAGEVLEAHVISALTPQTQHLILIGDHNQLRPNIATYSLSMNSSTGKDYQLDKSLFERLVHGDKAVKIEKAQLLTQRRMRNEISDLIRHTLYPNLIDGENTTKYSNVRGAQHNVYFIDHRHPEDNSDSDSALQSHVNTYEVQMVVEMVKYFVKNGYNKSDDIAVLTPYLGQMMKIRDALSKSFAVAIDERDAQNLAEMEETFGNISFDSIDSKEQLSRVKLRTVDNFQGEEANIVIISLVRNFSGFGEHDYDSIGFLKSTNRSNVLLSRAREGMYLIGNSKLMAARSKDMWAPVINMLQTRNPPQIGFGMPIVCNQHPDYKNIITEPEQFAKVSPNGSCHQPCSTPLPCGHTCPYKCHSENSEHKGVKCLKPCTKLHSDCNHPCPKLCSLDCGMCTFPIGDIILPCDHIIQNAKCWQNKTECRKTCRKILDCGHECLSICFKCPKHSISQEGSTNENKILCNFPVGDIILPGCDHVLQDAKCWQNQTKETLKCMTRVTRKLRHCEHLKLMNCFESVDDIKCEERCGKSLECGHECLGICFKCQRHQGGSTNENKIRCIFPVGDITLPGCNHVFQDARCWQNQVKETLKCMTPVTKKLPYCEHSKLMKCFESVYEVNSTKSRLYLSNSRVPICSINCEEKCGKVLECGHECLKECSKCPRHSIPLRRSGRSFIIYKIDCNFSVGDIILPGCNHVIQDAKCWQNQNKEKLECTMQVTKKLPYCEHSKLMKCFESIYDVRCKEKCRIRLKCGHECSNECYKCEESITPHEIRNTNCKSLCNKLLPCGHKCRQYCHKESNCRPCEFKCMISCKHTTCNKGCLEPCDACAKKCLWECKHQGKCELSCGVPCYRLPCNEECGETLKCGHKCAGVCGEVCPSKEFCVECAPKSVKSQISNMNDATFSEMDWKKERMIVLTCGHVYTMETMDMVMEMGDFYEGSIKDGWTSIKMLPTSITTIKTCPTCQTPIKDINRYGRVIKKYMLEAQIKNFISKYYKQLNQLKGSIKNISLAMYSGNYSKSSRLDWFLMVEFRDRRVKSRNYLRKHKFKGNFNPDHYFENINKYHGFSEYSERNWNNNIKALLKHKRDLHSIIRATETTPYKKAFEASVLNLRQAKGESENDLITEFPSEYLQSNFQETLSQVGISIPPIDRRIYLDIYFEIINVQKILLREILFIVKELSKELITDDFDSFENINTGWKKFADNLQFSIQNNLYNIRKVSESVQFYRELLSISVEILEFDFKMFKFQMKYPSNETDVVDEELKERIVEKCEEIKKNIGEIIKSEGYKIAEKEFKNDIHKRLEKVLKGCNEFEIRDLCYKPVEIII